MLQNVTSAEYDAAINRLCKETGIDYDLLHHYMKTPVNYMMYVYDDLYYDFNYDNLFSRFEFIIEMESTGSRVDMRVYVFDREWSELEASFMFNIAR